MLEIIDNISQKSYTQNIPLSNQKVTWDSYFVICKVRVFFRPKFSKIFEKKNIWPGALGVSCAAGHCAGTYSLLDIACYSSLLKTLSLNIGYISITFVSWNRLQVLKMFILLFSSKTIVRTEILFLDAIAIKIHS